jgi:uncharacterized membrane protein YqjE
MVAARVELARLDLAGHLYQIKRLTIGLVLCLTLAAAACMGLVSLAVILAHRWAVANYGEPNASLLVVGVCGALAGLGILVAWLRMRSFQRDFHFMEDTLAELQEDLVWLSEWTGDTGASAEDDRPE